MEHSSTHLEKRSLREVASAMSEGVILVGIDQTIEWANRAALELHGIEQLHQLGQTIDEYHANFQIRFSRARRAGGDEAESGAATFREAIAEVTPLTGERPPRIHRVRNLVLTDAAGTACGVALVLKDAGRVPAPHAHYLASLEALPRPALILQLADRRIAGVNAAFTQLTGLAVANVVGRDAGEFEFLATCLNAGAEPALRGRTRVPLPDGSLLSVEFDRQPILLGEQDGVLLTFFDLDSGWLAASVREGALGSHTASAGMLGAAVPAPLYILDERGRIISASDAFLAWIGHREAEVVGRDIADFLGAESRAYLHDHFLEGLRANGVGKDATCQFRARSGEMLAARVDGRAIGVHTPDPHYVCVATDLTAARRSEAGLQAIFALSPHPMVVRKAQDGRVLAVNPAFLDITGHTESETIGHVFDELASFDNPAVSRRFDAELKSGERPQRVDVRLRTAGGHSVECQLMGGLIHAFDQPCHVLALLDVTDRRRDERQLFQALEGVMKDSSWFSRMVVEKLATVRTPSASVGRSAELNDLTKREREVLAMISHGWSDAEIAQRLGLTRSTVRNHVAALYSKIEVHNRSSAIVWARDRALNVMFPAARFAPRVAAAE